MMILLLLCVIIAGVCKAVRDTLQFHYTNSVFRKCKNIQFWNVDISWKNKYKEGEIGTPKFWGSTTIFVWLTDAWHLFDMLGILFLFLGAIFAACAYVSLWVIVLYLLLMFVVYFVIFEVFYRLFII